MQDFVRVLLCYCKDNPMFLEDLSNILENLDNIKQTFKWAPKYLLKLPLAIIIVKLT